MDRTPSSALSLHYRRAWVALVSCVGLGVLNLFLFWEMMRSFNLITWFSAVTAVQCALGIFALLEALRSKKIGGPRMFDGLASPGRAVDVALDKVKAVRTQWSHTRLRYRTRQPYAELCLGSDWTLGPQPNPYGLDGATRSALEALWLHDAQKEHASIPAFARVSWLLAAAGAPPRLHREAQRCALEGIKHAECSFAFAAAYSGRQHRVQAMPELLSESLGKTKNALATLAYEGITEGCQLSDFSADLAAQSIPICQDEAARFVLEQITQEKRARAEFFWSLIDWALERDLERTRSVIAKAVRDLAQRACPNAVSDQNRTLIAAANPISLRLHGRLSDPQRLLIWQTRLSLTQHRLHALIYAGERQIVVASFV